MGGCASVPAELKKGEALPPEPAKEDTVPAAEEVKAEEADKKVEGGEEEKKEVVEEGKGPSLGNLLDQVNFGLDQNLILLGFGTM